MTTEDSDIPNLSDIALVIEPIAIQYLRDQQESIDSELQDSETREIREVPDYAGLCWEFSVDTNGEYEGPGGESVFRVTFNVLDSAEHDGDTRGYNVSSKAVWLDGTTIEEFTPYSYSPESWTGDIDWLKQRAEKMPDLTFRGPFQWRYAQN